MKQHKCSTCGRYHGRSVAVDGLLVKENKLLLIKRGHDPCKGMWGLPGGHLDPDETTEEACIRECKEETGLDVAIEGLVGVFSNPARHAGQTISIIYSVIHKHGELQAGDDAEDIGWFDLHALPELAFDHALIIDTYLKSRTTSIQ